MVLTVGGVTDNRITSDGERKKRIIIPSFVFQHVIQPFFMRTLISLSLLLCILRRTCWYLSFWMTRSVGRMMESDMPAVYGMTISYKKAGYNANQ